MISSIIAPGARELLDSPDADPYLVRRNLQDIAQANRWLGGRRSVAWALRRVLGGTRPRTRLSLLDIGAGSGDLARFCVGWAAARGLVLRAVGLERVPAAARVAAANGLPTLIGCASAVPVRSRAVDVILMSQVVHHFKREAAIELLRQCDRIARRAVIVVDLVRSPAARRAYRLGAGLLGFAPITVTDGLTSIDRGLTEDEARTMLNEAGILGHVQRVAPFRVVATWRASAMRERACER